MDFPGHYVYLRDDADGDFWSVSWQPVGKPLDQANYVYRHGLSYSKYLCDYKRIHTQQTLFVAQDAPVEIWDVVIRNDSDRVRNLSAYLGAKAPIDTLPSEFRNAGGLGGGDLDDIADSFADQSAGYRSGDRDLFFIRIGSVLSDNLELDFFVGFFFVNHYG